MLGILNSFADSSSGLGALGINGQSFLIQLVTFIIAFLVLRQWAFKPIMRIMNQRRETIEKGVKLGEEMQRAKVDLEQKITSSLHEARVQADKILAEAHDSGRKAISEAEEAARKKAEVLINEAGDRIKQDTITAKHRLEKDLVGLVAEATEAIIHEKVDAKKDSGLIDRALKERAKA